MFSQQKMAIAVDRTENSKLGPMATTYAAKSSCPDACPFKDTKACYGMIGPPSAVWKRLQDGTHTEVARDEAEVIAKLTGYVPLRLHTMGDCCTNKAARILAEAAKDYTAKQGQKVYTYTHAWAYSDTWPYTHAYSHTYSWPYTYAYPGSKLSTSSQRRA